MIFFWYEESSSAFLYIFNSVLDSVQPRYVTVNVFDGIPNLKANQHGMCLIDQTNHDGTLLHCLLCILYLEYPTLRGASLEQQVSPCLRRLKWRAHTR